MFPLILSLFLAEVEGSQNAGWVFAVSGMGGATLSWLTGIVSTATGSLRIGLTVPGVAALILLALITWPRTNRETRITKEDEFSLSSQDQRALRGTIKQ